MLNRKILAALGALSCLAGASAAASDTVTVRINTRLMMSAQGAEQVYATLGKAVRKACFDSSSMARQMPVVMQKCHIHLMGQLVAQADDAALAAVHEEAMERYAEARRF